MKNFILLLGIIGTITTFADEVTSNDDCRYITSKVGVRHRENKGVGYDTGYTTLDFFLAPKEFDRFQYFLDGRGHILNNGKFASNVGGGIRIAPNEKFAIGLNTYWDYRQVKHLPSHQIGTGVEFLSSYADFRFNGYFPVGNKSYVEKPQFAHFKGNSLLVNQKSKANLTSLYAEVGAPIPGPFEAVDLYLAAGPYYLFTRSLDLQNKSQVKTPAALGGKVRGSLRLYDGIEVGVDITYDHLFTWNAQGQISFTLPLGPSNLRRKGQRWKNRYKGKCQSGAKYVAMMSQPVQRNEIIPILKKKFTSPLSPHFLFLNSSAPFDGIGTFESPCNSLLSIQNKAAPSNIIYIFPGNGTYDTQTLGTDGFTMQEGQGLISAGTPYAVDNIVIPPHATSNPILTNAAPNGHITTLASGITINGLTLRGTPGGGNAINNIGSPKGNFTINQCIIEDNDGVPIRSFGQVPVGNITVTNNIFRNNALSLSGQGEFFLGSFLGGSVTFSNNEMTISEATNPALQLITNGLTTTDLTFTITHNTFINEAGGTAANGLEIGQSGSGPSLHHVSIIFTDNTVTNMGDTGLLVLRNGVTNNQVIQRNNFSGHTTQDIYLVRDITAVSPTQATIAVQNNTFGTEIKIEASPVSGNQICLDLRDNTGPLYSLVNTTGSPANFMVKSEDGTISGVESLNSGTITTTPSDSDFMYPPLNSTCYP